MNDQIMSSSKSRVPICPLDLFTTLRLSIPQQRWRRAFFAITSSRIFASKDATANEEDEHLAAFSRSLSHTILDIISDGDNVSSHCFNGDNKALIEIVKEKNPDRLRQFGGVQAVAAALDTDVDNGILGDAEHVASHRNIFGSNTYPTPHRKSLFRFVLEAFKDTIILILLGCALLSLGFGIRENGWKDGWYDGSSIFVAVIIVVAVSAFSNFRQSRQFEKPPSIISNNIQIDVIRSGRRLQISIFDIVVGDIVCLKIGDQIPADGLFIDGHHSLLVDEYSSMTGKSHDPIEVDGCRNPFLVSGTKVAHGCGRMLVTSVGMNTVWAEMMTMMSSINRDTNEPTPLQERLKKLTFSIEKLGLAVAVLVLIALLVRYFTKINGGKKQINDIIKAVLDVISYIDTVTVVVVAIPDGLRLAVTLSLAYSMKTTMKISEVMNVVVNIIVGSVTVMILAIPEGLPLAVTLSLAYFMRRIMADQAMVRKLFACEAMGSATTICTVKSGELTMNQMKVTQFWLGQDAIEDYASAVISSVILDLLRQAVLLPAEFSHSPTEKAILSWAVLELELKIEELKKTCTVLQVEAFNSEKKCSGLLMKKKGEKIFHIHWKGTAEVILAMCSSYYDRDGSLKFMCENERKKFELIIQKSTAANSLPCIAFAHKEITEEEELVHREDGKIHEKLSEEGLTLLGLLGLKDPCRPEIRQTVEACKDAGVHVKMITGDDISTSKLIAIECGILNPNHVFDDGQVVEGVEFRNYTQEERMEKVDRIRLVARSSPFDKLLMVKCLKQKGHVVAVVVAGDSCSNGEPALKEADIGLSMGIQGAEVAMVLRWGRCPYNNIQKFIQFQLTVNVAALVINFVAIISGSKVPLTTVQLLWMNLIIDTLGALALATEQPSKELIEKPPVGGTEPLITNVMWRNLVAQALYQILVLLTLQFRGESIFSMDKNTVLIFNAFVLCQVFNVFNARKLEEKNVFAGIHKNKLFLAIVGTTIILLVMIEFLKGFADAEKLDWREWCVCIGLAAISWPIGWVVKCIQFPEKPVLSFLKWEGFKNR